jgi:hypothetical protein
MQARSERRSLSYSLTESAPADGPDCDARCVGQRMGLFRGHLVYCTALQALLGIQLPAHRQWLPEAVKGHPRPLGIATWKWSPLQPERNPMPFLGNIQQGGHPATDEERQRIVDAAQQRATSELKDELTDLGRQLDALAGLVDAMATCRTALA